MHLWVGVPKYLYSFPAVWSRCLLPGIQSPYLLHAVNWDDVVSHILVATVLSHFCRITALWTSDLQFLLPLLLRTWYRCCCCLYHQHIDRHRIPPSSWCGWVLVFTSWHLLLVQQCMWPGAWSWRDRIIISSQWGCVFWVFYDDFFLGLAWTWEQGNVRLLLLDLLVSIVW
jgi:hypothetical protein